MADAVRALVAGATMFVGAETGREYYVPAGEERSFKGPEGDFATVPDGRLIDLAVERSPESGATSSGPARSYEANGSWKTFYESGQEVGKAQCSKDEAKAWTEGDLTLDDIQ